MDQRRMEHEFHMLEKQHELELLRQKESNKKKIADKIVKMEDSDQPDAYFCRFEDIMIETGIGQEEWPQRLRPLLTGKALAAYANNVPHEAKEKYTALEEALLEALGLTTEQCRLDIWTMTKKYGDSWQETARKIDSTVKRMTQGCITVQEVINMISLNKFLSLCSAECVNYAQVRQPKSSLEAANLSMIFFDAKIARDTRSRGIGMD